MAVEITPLGFQKPDGYELVRNGDNAISANAQKSEDLHTALQGRLGIVETKNAEQDGRIDGAEARNTTQDNRLTSLEVNDATQDSHLTEVDGRYNTFSARIGQAEANIAAGTGGTGAGVSEDPDNPGTYFIANTTPPGPIQPDPANPGLYTF